MRQVSRDYSLNKQSDASLKALEEMQKGEESDITLKVVEEERSVKSEGAEKNN